MPKASEVLLPAKPERSIGTLLPPLRSCVSASLPRLLRSPEIAAPFVSSTEVSAPLASITRVLPVPETTRSLFNDAVPVGVMVNTALPAESPPVIAAVKPFADRFAKFRSPAIKLASPKNRML